MNEPLAANSDNLVQMDQQTLAQLRRGQYSAMEALVWRYQDRLFATALRIVQNPDDAADVVQETFVKALQHVRHFEGKSSLYTWLFRIAVNQAISLKRRRLSHPTQSLDAWDAEVTGPAQGNGSMSHGGGTGGVGGGMGGGINRQAAGLRKQMEQQTEPNPAAEAEAHMDHELVLRALGWLEPEQRAIIVLRDVEDCDYEQMAAILEVPLGTIKSRLFRARLALREELQRHHGRAPTESQREQEER